VSGVDGAFGSVATGFPRGYAAREAGQRRVNLERLEDAYDTYASFAGAGAGTGYRSLKHWACLTYTAQAHSIVLLTMVWPSQDLLRTTGLYYKKLPLLYLLSFTWYLLC
jgi:hypothetical protein